MMIVTQTKLINIKIISLFLAVVAVMFVICYLKPNKNADAITLQRSPIDVVLVIDASGSMDSGIGSNLSKAESSASSFINSLQPGDKVSVVAFDDSSYLIQPLTSSIVSTACKLTNTANYPNNQVSSCERYNISGGGTTVYTKALEMAYGELIGSNKTDGATPVIVFLSDGQPNYGNGPLAISYCNNTLKPAGVQIYTIALGGGSQTLIDMASSTAGTTDHYANAADADKLKGIYDSITASLIRLLSLAQNSQVVNQAGDYSITTSSPSTVVVEVGKPPVSGIKITKSTVIKSGGTVTIQNNIINDPNVKYNDVSKIPQMVIIAKDIVIAAGVTQVDAWLIAKNAIYTCYPNTGNSINDASELARYLGNGAAGNKGLTINDCDKQLKINGPVMTNHLYMLRTYGSGVSDKSGVPAEVFNLRADAYLWAAAHSLVNGRVQTTYTTELPPRF